jgi:hypothetical protein
MREKRRKIRVYLFRGGDRGENSEAVSKRPRPIASPAMMLSINDRFYKNDFYDT